MKLSVVIPVYNEAATVRQLVERVLAVDLGPDMEWELVVVDDGSTDATADELARARDDHPQIKIYHHPHNQGKGAALRTGFEAASGDMVIVQDGDLEYNPADYPRLLDPILAGKADVVFGSRFIGSRPHRVLYFRHAMGNRLLTLLSNLLTNLNLTDMETCYKLMRREVVQRITIEEDRFGVEPELTAKIARQRCRVFEVGISYNGRTYEQGKKIHWGDGAWAVWCIFKYALSSAGRERDRG